MLDGYPSITGLLLQRWKAVWAGIGTVGVGVYIVLASLGVIAGKAHVPEWIIGAAGGLFISVGLYFIAHGVIDLRRAGRAKRALEAHPNEPWRGDWDWGDAGNLAGVRSRDARQRWSYLVGIPIVAFFPLITHGLAASPQFQGSGAGKFVFAMALLCDLILVWGVLHAGRKLMEQWRYGTVRISFARVPFYPGEAVDAHIRCPKGFRESKKLTVTLRFVVEKIIESRSSNGSGTKQKLVCYEQYRDEYVIDDVGGQYGEGDEFPVLFELPADAPSNDMSSMPARFWDIEIRRETRGVNLVHRFAVPVYRVGDQ